MKRILCALALAGAFASCTKHEPARPVAAAKPARPAEAAQPRTEVGDMMPAYSATYVDGKPFDLGADKGSVVFLNVWATWCAPCRAEIPELQALNERYGKSGFKLIGVSVDEGEPSVVKQFATEQKVAYSLAHDPEGRIATIVQTTVLPTSLLIDRQGRIVWRQVGAITQNDAKLNAAIAKALAQKAG
jgi:thiol-disulfide isomerase/thioredoxin